jgi:protein gp37
MRFSGYIPTPDSIDYVPLKDYPLPNVWLGVSIEDQKTADERIPLLLQTPAAVRFVSVEPMLGEVEITQHFKYDTGWKSALDWVICGCESGPNRRPMDVSWARLLQEQCYIAHIPFFLKQMEIDGKAVKMPALDGVVYDQYPEAK